MYSGLICAIANPQLALFGFVRLSQVVASKPVGLQAKGSYPMIAALSRGAALATWESEGKIVIRDLN